MPDRKSAMPDDHPTLLRKTIADIEAALALNIGPGERETLQRDLEAARRELATYFSPPDEGSPA